MSETNIQGQSVNVADVSSAIHIPSIPKWKTKAIYDFESHIFDYENLADLGFAINAARIALFRITEKINEQERIARLAKLTWEREYRRTYLTSVEKTNEQRHMRAALANEHLENDYIAADQLKDELNRTSNALRLELQTLQTIGNNIRQQMRVE